MSLRSPPRRVLWAATVAMLCATAPRAPAADLVLTLPPTARQVADVGETGMRIRVPVGPWAEGGAPARVAEGEVRRRVWQIGSVGRTVEQLAAPLREALGLAGYDILLDCAATACGGFEFRFSTNTLPPPEMYVDLGDYRYISARAEHEGGPRWATLMVSRSDATGFIQLTEVSRAAPQAVVGASVLSVPPPPQTEAPETGVLDALTSNGRAVLWDLSFAPGSADLAAGPFPALADLAAWMAENAQARIVLVGHTDADGALPGNIDLSRRRADAVRARLVERHGADAARLRAEGVGYLSPLAPNDTAEGRERNRRVEVILAGDG